MYVNRVISSLQLAEDTYIFARRQNRSKSSRLRWVIWGANIISLIFATLNVTSKIIYFTVDARAFFLAYINLPLHRALRMTYRAEDMVSAMANWVGYLAVGVYLTLLIILTI